MKNRFSIVEQERESDKVFEGDLHIGSQYHNYMETHTHVVRPIENGEFEVYPATQMHHSIHVFLSKVLGIPSHKFDVKVSYAKSSRPPATLFALVCIAFEIN